MKNQAAAVLISFAVLMGGATTAAYAQNDRQATHVEPPQYPRAAERRGIEGVVTITYSITAEGEVVSAEVTEANPEGVFDRAALAAVNAWRFEPAEGQTDGHTQRLEFSMQ